MNCTVLQWKNLKIYIKNVRDIMDLNKIITETDIETIRSRAFKGDYLAVTSNRKNTFIYLLQLTDTPFGQLKIPNTFKIISMDIDKIEQLSIGDGRFLYFYNGHTIQEPLSMTLDQLTYYLMK